MSEDDEQPPKRFETCLAIICITLGLYFIGSVLYNYWTDDKLCKYKGIFYLFWVLCSLVG